MVKKTKNILLIVMLAIVLTLSVCLMGCGKAPSVTINSSKEVSLQLGETSVVDFSTANADTVTVTVKKGEEDVTAQAYSESDKTFTAVSTGTFTMTITAAQKKKNATGTVTFTVAEATKTDLQAALAEAESKQQKDYSAGWAAFKKAKDAAAEVAVNGAATKAEVEKALADLRAAMNDLESNVAAITRADVAKENVIVYKGITYDYSTHEQASIQAAYDKVVALNNDASIKYQSVYDAKMKEIIDAMVARLEMNLVGGGVFTTFASTGSKTVPVVIQTEEGATITYAVKTGDTYGDPIAVEGNKIDVPLNIGDVKDIRVYGVKGEHTNTKDVTVGLVRISATFSSSAAGASTFDAENNKLVNDRFLAWETAGDLAKKFNPDVELVGDFEVRMTVKVTEKKANEKNVAIAVNLDQGQKDSGRGEFAIRYSYGDNLIKGLKAGGGGEAGTSDCGDRLDADKVNTFVLKRIGNVGYFYIEEEKDGVLTEVGKVNCNTFDGAVRLGINYENAKCEITDISIWAEQVVNKTALRAAIEATTNYISADYTADSWKTFSAAKASAREVLTTVGATQTEIDAAIKLLADSEPVAAEIEKAVVAAEDASVAYDGKTYLKERYTTASWTTFVAAVKVLNTEAGQGYLPSQYDSEFVALTAGLEEMLKLSCNVPLEKVTVLNGAQNVTFTAETTAGVEISKYEWKLDDVVVPEATAATFTVNNLDGRHTVQVTVTLPSGGTLTADSFVDVRQGVINSKDGYESKKFITDDAGSSVTVKGATGWTTANDRAWVEDVVLTGNFTVEADITYLGKFQGGANVAVIMASSPSSDTNFKQSGRAYAAFLYQNGQLEVSNFTDAGKIRGEENVFDRTLFGTIRVRFERQVLKNGSAKYVTSYLVNGAVVKSVETVEENAANVDAVRIGFNSENVSVQFSNVKMVADGVIDTRAMGAAIAAAKNINIADYDAENETVQLFAFAYDMAKSYYLNGDARRMIPKGTTQADIDAAVKALTDATAAMQAVSVRAVTDADKPVVTAESEAGKKDGKLVFDGVTYLQANVINYEDILTSVNAIDTTDMTVTVYRAAVKAELAKAYEVVNEVNLNDLLTLDTGKVKTVGVYKQEVFKFVYTKTGEEVPELKINGTVVVMTLTNDTYEYTLRIQKGLSYEVSFDNKLAAEANKTVTLTYGNSLQFEARSNVSQWMTLDGEKITQANGDPGWGGNWYEKQKAMSGTVITGDDVKVTFTTEFISGVGGNQQVFGLFMGKAPSLNKNGSIQNGEYLDNNTPVYVIKWNDKKLAIEFDDGGQKPSRSGMSFDDTKPYTFTAERKIARDESGKATNVHYTFSIVNPLSAEDNSLVVFERDSWMDGSNVRDYTGPISLKWQWEGLKSSVYDIKVETDGGIFNYTEYFAAINEAVVVNTDNYTDDSASAFKAALKNSIQAYYNRTVKTQAEADAYTKALKDAQAALVSELDVKEVTVDLSKEQEHNINYYDNRQYNVTLTNAPADSTVKAYVNGVEAAITADKVSFVSDNTLMQTELKIVVTDAEGAEINVSYVRARTLQLQSKASADVKAEKGYVFNDLYDIHWDIGDRVKAYAVGTFSGADTTVTYKTRMIDAKNTSWNHLQFIMATDANYSERENGRLGIKYNIGKLIGDKEESAKAVNMPKEVEYANRDLIKVGEERVLQLKTSHVEGTGDEAGRTFTKLVLSDITGDVTMDSVGQRIAEENIGFGFQYENCAGVFYGIEIYEVVTR